MTAETFNTLKEIIKPLEAVGFVMQPLKCSLEDTYRIDLYFENHEVNIWESDILKGDLSAKKILSDLIYDAQHDAMDSVRCY